MYSFGIYHKNYQYILHAEENFKLYVYITFQHTYPRSCCLQAHLEVKQDLSSIVNANPIVPMTITTYSKMSLEINSHPCDLRPLQITNPSTLRPAISDAPFFKYISLHFKTIFALGP